MWSSEENVLGQSSSLRPPGRITLSYGEVELSKFFTEPSNSSLPSFEERLEKLSSLDLCKAGEPESAVSDGIGRSVVGGQ